MAGNIQEEEIERLVRERLNRDGVKLWLPPYTTEDDKAGERPEELSHKYSKDLKISADVILCTMEKLRVHAVEKLAARKRYQQTGIAVLKIKLAGHVPQQIGTKRTELNLETEINISGLQLKQKISAQTTVPVSVMKLITGGRVVKDEENLQEQGIKHQSQLMAICQSQTEADMEAENMKKSEVAKTREAAEILVSKQDGGWDGEQNYYVQVADQSGKPLELPPEERKALALAMTLHEKGKAELKRRDYGRAVLLLLEADEEFRKCSSSLLESVDNFGLLCLDIVWCYLCLQNVQQLPDAEARLQSCEECFHRSYGPNLERLAVVKGGTANEQALLMRLHLLQGILAYHKSQYSRAMQMLNKTDVELQALHVDENKLTEVMAMGFTAQEARLGLRACRGDIGSAVTHIMTKREEKEERLKKEREEKRKKKAAHKLGKTANGQCVSIDAYESLLSMGFPKGAAAEALRQTNNDIPASLQVLEEHPEFLNLPDPESPKDVAIPVELLAQVAAMGFDYEAARLALQRCSSDVQRAIDELLKTNGIIPPQWLTDSSASGTSGESSGEGTSQKSAAELQREQEAIEAIIPDIPQDEEDHLDLTLDEEAQFLLQYKTMLQSMR